MVRCNRIAILIISSAFIQMPCFAQQDQNTAILPIPNPPNLDVNKVELGKTLFKANLFAKNTAFSCNSCHILKRGGVDNLPTYVGINRTVGLFNTPTVYNASLNFRQFWNGRAKTIEDVVEDHVKDPTIFANDWPTIVERIKAIPEIDKAFKESYNHEISAATIKDAFNVYLQTLLTPQSPFDRYLQGDKSALTADELKGFQLFKSYGCITCHQGPNVGGNLYQKLGIYKDYFAGKTNISKADLGLFNVTGKPEDKYVFRVPSLRNVTLTAPYLHDGSASTLDEVIQLMGVYQVGQTIQPFDVPYIAKFLHSLSGKLPSE